MINRMDTHTENLVNPCNPYPKKEEGVLKFSSLDFSSADNTDYAKIFFLDTEKEKKSVLSAQSADE